MQKAQATTSGRNRLPKHSRIVSVANSTGGNIKCLVEPEYSAGNKGRVTTSITILEGDLDSLFTPMTEAESARLFDQAATKPNRRFCGGKPVKRRQAKKQGRKEAAQRVSKSCASRIKY